MSLGSPFSVAGDEARAPQQGLLLARYVGLFPLLMRMLPADSPQLAALLGQLRSPQQLWTPHGLRSLSAAAALYNQSNTQHDAPYWRAPIWLNINYLALAALRHYSQARRSDSADACMPAAPPMLLLIPRECVW